MHFLGVTSFNKDLPQRDVARINNLGSMFAVTHQFNRDVSGSIVMSSCLRIKTHNFNQDLPKWDMSRVINMQYIPVGQFTSKQSLCDEVWINSKVSDTSVCLRREICRGRVSERSFCVLLHVPCCHMWFDTVNLHHYRLPAVT